ncbi:hypothetical protein LMG28727_00146 [Paraburkholderia kirstenboschensis]|uniref:T6SS phospholipase effector Tle1-like catalytic domain-containing protein n=2 Tax=Paraburkholderia kirstenboschensis TaxID=1245436 RepID=UPI00191AEA66|nr:DUF2235 domain-containing protein [Paraburkholderia kirstenboschensis]CAD6508390.1 hypothetical protein LMG28727_00146 [Paraburkholderia kirstenboschensis]
MASEQLQSALSANRDVPNSAPSPKQDCSDVVNISLFFDGTGNNQKADEPKNKSANPSKMYRAAALLVGNGKPNYPIYISGVGTPFNGTATDWLDGAWTATQDNVAGGMGGAGGTRRTDFGKHNVNDKLRMVLLGNAQKLNATTKAYAEQSKGESLGELSKALAAHRLIKIINLSVFGFSRGAALARTFANDFLNECKTDKQGQLTYQGFPVRIQFMGLFDTVASFGVPSANMDSVFTEKNLKVPGAVERCVHYVAGHELRFSFPVDLIRQHGKLMPNWTETIYPGVHSDVGGGYAPVDQRLSNNLARIPLRDMMSEAAKAGARLLAYNDMAHDPKQRALFSEQFAVDPETDAAFTRYMSAVPASGPTENVVNAHMKALYSAYGTMSRRGIRTPDNNSDIGHRLLGHASMAQEVKALRSRRAAAGLVLGEESPLQIIGTVYGQMVKPEAWRLEAWDTTATDDVLGLISKYVHDSKAGFLCGVEPFSYFRQRGMTECSHNVLAEGLQWLDANANAAREAVIKVYNAAGHIVVETWQAGEMIATKTYKVGETFVVDTVAGGQKYAVEVYQTSRKVVITKIDEGQRVVIDSVDMVQKEASSALDALKRKAASVTQQVQQGARSAADATGKAIDSGMQTVEDGWQSTKAALHL